MRGIHLKIVQVLMGHKQIIMTARYAHLAASHKKAAVELIVSSWRKKEQNGQELLPDVLALEGRDPLWIVSPSNYIGY